MARWRLRTSHYLNVPGIQWEREEMNRDTGKSHRERLDVPLLVDITDPSFFNDGSDVIVCHQGKGQRRDIIFVGDPTPDMEPIDDEAEAISKALASKWAHPIDTLPATGGFEQTFAQLMERMMEKMPGAFVPSQAVSVPDNKIDQLQAMMEKLMAQNAELAARNEELMAKLAQPELETVSAGRRV